MHILNNVMEYYGEEWRVISALQEKVCSLIKKEAISQALHL